MLLVKNTNYLILSVCFNFVDGGSVRILNEKLNWNKQAKIDAMAKDYRPGGKQNSVDGLYIYTYYRWR